MANNCYNNIEITGSKEEIKNFAQLLELNDQQEDGCDIYANLIHTFESDYTNNAKWFDMDYIEVEDENMTISGILLGVPLWICSRKSARNTQVLK